MNPYPDAGKDAQPEVQAAILRFSRISPSKKNSVPLLYWLIGGSTQRYKMPPDMAEYYEPSSDPIRDCESCKHFWINIATGAKICAMIRGGVSEQGVCKFWEPPA